MLLTPLREAAERSTPQHYSTDSLKALSAVLIRHIMALPLPNTPDRSGPPPRPLLFLSRVSPSQSSSTPRQIRITSDRLLEHDQGHDPTPTASLLSLTTLRPLATAKRSSPKLIPSLQSTIKYLTPLPVQPHLSSFQQILNRLSPRSPPVLAESEATARPRGDHSPVVRGIEGVKVDELVHEVCWKCRKERETEEMQLRRVQGHGLQWMCTGGCGNQTECPAGSHHHDVGHEKEKEPYDVP